MGSNAMEADASNKTGGGIEHLAFDVDGQSYAIDISIVREIRGWTEPSGMPNTDPYVMGVISLRGEVLTLLDLAAKLGLKTPEINARSVIIVVETQEEVVGLLVDSVSNIIAPSPADMRDPPETAKSGDARYVSALTLLDDTVVRILDLSALLPAEEETLAEVS